MISHICNLAIETAMKSTASTFKHGAVLFSGGKILSTSFNSPGCTSHAETLVLKKYFNRQDQLKVANSSN